MGTSWCHFFSMHLFVLFSLNAILCFSFLQATLHKTSTLCHADERSALLQFKQSFTIDKSASGEASAYPKVASWSTQEGDHESSNCCSWDGVECDEDSGHVIGLDLRSSCLYGSVNSSSTLFQLAHLQRLDLSDNDFDLSQIPSRLGHDLTGLTYLNLSSSLFSGEIPSQISELSKLSTLDLSFNFDPSTDESLLELTEANLRSIVQNLTNIKQLDLSGVLADYTLPDIIVNASSLTSLRLEWCGFQGEFPVGIFHLPNLEVLHLEYNYYLSGYFPDDLNMSSPLKELNVENTDFSGHLPASIGNLRSLNLLDISNCHFYPHLPSSLGNLTHLSYLELYYFYDSWRNIHNLSGQAIDSWSWVGKLTKLRHLGLGYTNLRGEFPCFVANLTQLVELDLSENQISGEIPSWHVNLTQLVELDLSENQISGEIPSWLMKLTQLTVLNLQNNNLQGPIPRSLFNLQNLEYLDLNKNNLSGVVDFDEFSKLKRLKELRLSSNNLSLHITTGFNATAPQFEVLDLGSCNLTEFPQFINNQYKLKELDLPDNRIHGQIPKWMWNSTRETLMSLILAHNSLTGFEQNPTTLPKWPNLLVLDLGFNRLQGPLPSPPPSILVFSVPNNGYTGQIPPSICNLWDLDLSNNKLSGIVPQCVWNSGDLMILKLRNNSFHGHIHEMCSSGDQCGLQMIDLSYNQFQGKLPRSLANCSMLRFLNVENNQIIDIFPSWLGALPLLRVLNLRSNGFHGVLEKPTTDHEFPELCIIDLSNNAFSGMLPSDYLENLNCMKSVDKDEENYFSNNFHLVMLADFYIDYSMTISTKGVEMNYSKTPYPLRAIDLSSNRFEGEIPGIIGSLRALRFLNLSSNTLNGSIPSSLGNLTALESLDLAHNQLSGKIPGNLTQLTFLAHFNVSSNHLWGPIPHGQQFDTFQEDSYQGNRGLCGKPLSKKCEDSESSTPPPPSTSEANEDSGFQIELDWYVVVPGVVSGLVVGVVTGNIFATKNHAWFVKTFGRRRQPRGTRGRRGHRT